MVVEWIKMATFSYEHFSYIIPCDRVNFFYKIPLGKMKDCNCAYCVSAVGYLGVKHRQGCIIVNNIRFFFNITNKADCS